MKLRSIASALPLAALLAACSSSQDAGVAGPTNSQSTSVDKNPYGAVYPTDNQGYSARRGNKAGNVMKNYKFLGYPHSDPKATVDTSQGLKSVQLADFYDPEMRKYKVIHITVAAVWCGPCNEETDATVPVVGDLAQQGVVFLQALDDGRIEGVGATQKDLDQWILDHKSNFTEVLDPGLKAFGQFFDAAAVPWNANLDARTMEILSAGVGAPPDITKEMQQWIDFVNKNPPSYQPPASK